VDDTDRAIINTLQGGFPLCEEPYRQAAESLGLTAHDRTRIPTHENRCQSTPHPQPLSLKGRGELCESASPTFTVSEQELIARLERMLKDRVLTRFGPMFQVERMGGAFVLAALAVPEERFEAMAEQVNALPEVAHNYRREHLLNMWFVLATETPEGIARAVARIEADTGLKVHAFPKEKEYFVEMRLLA
jgi:DNA-binding Lrp family transcriptional regulator